MTELQLRAEIASPKSIRLYRGAALVGHVYTADPTFGWRVTTYTGNLKRHSRKQFASPDDAAFARLGAEGRAAVRIALEARAGAA